MILRTFIQRVLKSIFLPATTLLCPWVGPGWGMGKQGQVCALKFLELSVERTQSSVRVALSHTAEKHHGKCPSRFWAQLGFADTVEHVEGEGADEGTGAEPQGDGTQGG